MTVRRTALVTGASRGIGLAVARAFLDRGMRVCITARNQEALDKAAAGLGAPDSVLALAGSSSDPEHRAVAVARTMGRFGSVDILVNHAGINPTYGPLVGADLNVVQKTLATNVVAPLGWVQEVHRAWMGEHGGAVVNIGSIAGLRPQLGLGAYVTSKAALLHLTRQLAFELGPDIRVNAVVPALVRTKFAAALYDGNEPALLAHYPLGRLGRAEDVASAVAFLASDEAQWITGESLVVDGGLLVNDSVSEVPA
ncbi:SDR family oxidoreductase [Streptomyces sp. GbtcB7]|uniref:SDR family oxidoreductase n=1 Tax=Streptomyces sp. GbtcB7 TaxID=2824752 RepID=UPI001C30C4CA|nr:SDR family oxidoreductase [Streptomyces sp. GbtcB7]